LNNFNYIQEKLHNFIRKYYTNEIIKGSILFLSFGLLYFIFTLVIEYFFWLRPVARTVLFWGFILVEMGFIFYFIITPLLRLIGLKKGISSVQASRIIGDHFKEVDDKLLNVLQLKNSSERSDLLLASIEQKARNLNPVPFKKAINFKTNYKYLKYLTFPLLIWLFIYLSGNNSIFTQSMKRVIDHNTAYSPPAPFHFKILNNKLQSLEGKSFKLELSVIGNIIPENVKIIFNKETYYLNQKKAGEFEFLFEYPVENIEFHLEANWVISKNYILEVYSTPKITDFEMELNFPAYTQKQTEIYRNTGNASIPEGTEVIWQIKAQNTDVINFITEMNQSLSSSASNKKTEQLVNNEEENFKLTKKVLSGFSYRINTSNEKVKSFEELNYQIEVIKDEYPRILVKTDMDSVQRGPVQFIGQLSDDYGISKLQVVAKNRKTGVLNQHNVKVDKIDLEEFYYRFPDGFILQEGTGYEIYFEVFDNDKINGKKKSVSQKFFYNNKTQDQIENEILQEQKQSIDDIENTSKKAEDLQRSLDNFSKKLKTKNNTDWNDKKEFDEFLERQKKYEQMLQKNTDKLLENLEEMDEENSSNLEDKKQNLKDRIEEAKELQKKQDLLKELEELAKKLQKEDLLNKMDRLKEQSKQESRSLERILELTKRFYVEKKSEQIIKKLNELSEEQMDLSKKETNEPESQDKLNKKFDSIQKDFKDLEKQNGELKEPMQLQETKPDQKLIEMEMQEALDELKKEENESNKSKGKEASKKQSSAAKKMKELSDKMKDSLMQMEMESNEENIKDLQQILENLIVFSFDQEELMLSLKGLDSKNAEYPDKLKSQIKLKEYFEHVDDSLYTLSLRLVRLSSKIQKDLTDAHYNLGKSLENIEENRIAEGRKNQQYTMTAANNLADLLSDLLQNLQNKKPGSGKGKGKKGEELSLPDIIKKQGELLEKMKQGKEKGQSKGEKSKEIMSGEQFEIYKEQSRIKEQLNELMKEGNGAEQSKKIEKQMEELEKLLLEKGITNETINNMQKIEHELLKLEKATFNQNEDSKRKSNNSENGFQRNSINKLNEDKLYFKEDEILIRNYLDLQPDYQKRIKKYYQRKDLSKEI